jgi:hypothetical protein
MDLLGSRGPVMMQRTPSRAGANVILRHIEDRIHLAHALAWKALEESWQRDYDEAVVIAEARGLLA